MNDLQKIADEATEMQVLAGAATEEGWRVNKSEPQWFAEKPCHSHVCSGNTQHCAEWGYHCYEHEEKTHCAHCCNGTLFVRVRRKNHDEA